MKKYRIYTLFLSLIIVLGLLFTSVNLHASGQPKLVDFDQLLTQDEFNDVNAKLEKVSEKLGIDVVVLTVSSLEGKDSESFADDYYDEHGYSDDGILLLIAMNEREFAVSTKGSAIDVFTLDELDDMEAEFIPMISRGNYAEGFETYAEEVDTRYSNYDPDKGNGNRKKDSLASRILKYLPFSALLGGIFSAFSTGKKKADLTSVTNQTYAGNYIQNENITDRRDVFLYHTVNRTPKPKDKEKHGGSHGEFSGGHISSSGEFHGGNHGKF